MRFRVFENGQPAEKFKLCGDYLFGSDGVAIRRAEITYKNGIIRCKKPNQETAGLALLWPIEGFGRVLLPTTCLPEREEPYNLNVEIARAKLMQIIMKREDWSYFNNLEAAGGLPKEAQNLFIQAIQNISDAPLASKLADAALEKAIVLSENLAREQAESLFEARVKSHGFGRGCLGCQVEPALITNPKYVENLLKLFGFITVPLNWAQIEVQKGTYDFSTVDACIEFLSKKKVVIGAGPLLRFSKEYIPKWLTHNESAAADKADFGKIRDSAYRFVSMVVGRYASVVRTWRVISGLNAYNHFGFNFEQVLEMTRAATMAVKAASERGLKMIEITNPWGEYYGEGLHTIPPLVYVDMVVQSGINFDAFGLMMQFGKNQAGMHVRDMMQISAILDYFLPIAKPLYITDVEVPSKNDEGPDKPDAAGVWHGKWDETRQGQWIDEFYKIALSKPFVDTVTYSHLADTEGSIINHSGLLTGELEPKKSFLILKQLHDAIFSR